METSKSIVHIGINQDGKTATVAFGDNTDRQYQVQYTKAGRRYIRVYGRIIYDWRGKAI